MTGNSRFTRGPASIGPQEVLDFWFPAGLDEADRDAVRAFFRSRMQGGMDAVIIAGFADVALAAAKGQFDHWAATPEGRLALILALDQFPRSLWRDTPAAFAQDIRATRIALEGIANGHYHALPELYRRTFYIIAIGHCEGPDHIARMDLLIRLASDTLSAETAPWRREALESTLAQCRRIREVVAQFGRHPHRNAILGRISTPDEEAYIRAGDFPHLPGTEKPR